MTDKKKIETIAFRLKNVNTLRQLFHELNYEIIVEPIDKQTWSDSQKEIVVNAEIIAKKERFKVYFLEINSNSVQVIRGIAGKIISANSGFCIVISKNSETGWTFSCLSKEFSKSFSETRHFPIEIKASIGISSSFVDFLEKIDAQSQNTISLRNKISNAFDSFAVELHDELTINVYEALKILSEGIINEPENNLALSNETLEKIREPIFILLYRIIFILYAEDREIFSNSDIFYEKFSIKWIKFNWLSSNQNKLQNYEVQERLKNLFRLIEVGSEDLGFDPSEFSMRSYYGRLFDRHIHYQLEKWKISNETFLQAISFLTRTRDKKGNYFFLDYSTLETRHLGSIYEHLLEFHLSVKGAETVELPTLTERKESGSYYTPQIIVDYIVEHILEPIIKKILDENHIKDEQIEKILSLKILDPAMGSGHFLVGVIEYLAKRLCEIEYGEIKEKQFIERKRDVVRHCIYGVDKNSLAVDLTRLSLWLETLLSDKPLSFLSAHLKTGNSLLGTNIEEIYL